MAEFEWNGKEILAQLRGAEMDGLELAAEHLLQVSSFQAPLEEGDLARSGEVSKDEEAGAVAVSYDRPYLGSEAARGPHAPARCRKEREVPRSAHAHRARHHARVDRRPLAGRIRID